jgi:tetratricopeptide (TPR) repeat protein
MMIDHPLIANTNTLSRRGARMAALGALLLVLAFAGSIWQLDRIEVQLKAKRAELIANEDQLLLVRSQMSTLSKEVSQLRVRLRQFRELNKRLDDAIRPQTDRDYQTSVKLLLDVVKFDPENEVALFWLSRAYSKLEQHNLAMHYAERAIKIDRSYVDPYVIMVWSLHRAGYRKHAVEYLKYALNLSIDAYGHFWVRQRELSELWKIKDFRDEFLAHEQKIRYVQSQLAHRGLYSGEVDGLVGSRTRHAITQYSVSQGITNNVTMNSLIQLLRR